MKKIVLLILFMFVSTSLYAAPSITGVSGTVDEGESFEITGTGFGTPTLSDIEYLQSNIDAGTLDAQFSTPTGWTDATGEKYYYKTDNVLVGTKSLKAEITSPNDGSGSNRAELHFDIGSALSLGEELFVSWWAYLDASAGGQFKTFRINHNNGNNDTAPEITQFSIQNTTPASVKDDTLCRNDSAVASYWTETQRDEADGTNNSQYGADAFQPDRWVKQEWYLKTSSANDTWDGVFWRKLYSPDDSFSVKTLFTESAVSNYASGETNRLRYCVWQSYSQMTGTSDYWVAGLYISKGSQARCVVTDSSTWGSETKSFVCMPTSVSSTSWTVDLSIGDFAENDTAYLFIVDEDGVASNSVEVTIGGGGGEITPEGTVTISKTYKAGSTTTIGKTYKDGSTATISGR